MRDIRATKHIISMEIERERKNGKLFLSQQKRVEKVLAKFGMENVKHVTVPFACTGRTLVTN